MRAFTSATFTPALFQEFGGLGDPSEEPVFVVGLPRSGTSLPSACGRATSRWQRAN